MLPTFIEHRKTRAKAKVRLLADNSMIVRANVAQVYRPETWR